MDCILNCIIEKDPWFFILGMKKEDSGLSFLQVKLASKLLFVAHICILVVWIKDKPQTVDQWYNETFRILPLERLGAVSNGNEARFENV